MKLFFQGREVEVGEYRAGKALAKEIGGRTYTVEASFEIGSWNNGAYNRADLVRETLYRTVDGGYFLRVFGGYQTAHSVRKDGRVVESYAIRLLSDDEAEKWAGELLDEEQFLEEFGEETE